MQQLLSTSHLIDCLLIQFIRDLCNKQPVQRWLFITYSYSTYKSHTKHTTHSPPPRSWYCGSVTPHVDFEKWRADEYKQSLYMQHLWRQYNPWFKSLQAFKMWSTWSCLCAQCIVQQECQSTVTLKKVHLEGLVIHILTLSMLCHICC